MQKVRLWLKDPYILHIIIFFYFIIFAFIVNTPYEIYRGLIEIVLSYDLLITDYVAVGGVGATLVNAAVTTLMFLVFIKQIQPKASGPLIMAFWLLAGFAFFGKNIVNVWPIIIGGYLYSKFRGESFSKYAVITALATSLGPSVTQMAMLEHIPLFPSLVIAMLFGIMIGFIMPPIAQNMLNLHNGFNLYNIGFSAGILAILTRIFVIAIRGGEISPVFIWSYEYWITLTIFMTILFLFLLFVGINYGENRNENLLNLYKRSGQAPSDYYAVYREVTYINMGILGLFCTALMLGLRSDINGPVMGSIFTVVGFGAFGKHIKNIWPVMLGCLIAGGFRYVFFGIEPSVSLAILLVTCLAPIPGHYGWKWGVVAGFIHLYIAKNAAAFSGGFNLYNNGLAGGFVVMLLLPIIRMLHEHKNERRPQAK